MHLNYSISNATQTMHSSSYSALSVFVPVFVIWAPGLITNSLAILYIVRDIRKAVFPAIILLFVLCCADLNAVMFSAVNHLAKQYLLEVTYFRCAILSVLQSFFRIFSGVMNSFMAIDRVLAICYPFYYKRKIDISTWKIGCLLAAVAVGCFTCFPLIGLGNVIKTIAGMSSCTSLSYFTKKAERVYGIMFASIGFLCTACIVIGNIVVIRAVIKMRNRIVNVTSEMSSTTDTSGSSNASATSFEFQFAKLMGCLAAVYLLCGTPYNAIVMMQQFNVTVNMNEIGYIHLLAGTSYSVDPVVYILIRKINRKRKIRDFLCRCK